MPTCMGHPCAARPSLHRGLMGARAGRAPGPRQAARPGRAWRRQRGLLMQVRRNGDNTLRAAASQR